MEVEYAGGKKTSFRILPSTARNGLLLNYLPATIDDVAGLFLGSSRVRVERFRVGGSGGFSFQPRFGVNWKEADTRIAYREIGKGPLEALTSGSDDSRR